MYSSNPNDYEMIHQLCVNETGLYFLCRYLATGENVAMRYCSLSHITDFGYLEEAVVHYATDSRNPF